MSSKMVREVDLRSDTVTKPTAEMRRVMAEAVVGDDVYQEDPTINALEERVAKLLGKEAGIYVASGTMGNLAAIMAHCWTRGQEVVVGELSHILKSEQGGVAQLGGVNVSTLKNLDDGTFSLEELKEKFRPANPDIHEPSTGVVCLENTNNRCGGRVLPQSFIQQVCDISRDRGVPVHMDGARLLNAAVHSGIPPHEIVKDCASVSMCLSKGIGAPVGSVVVGSKEFIVRVRRCRKVLGGAMRQAGILAAAALVGLDSAMERLSVDHKRAKKLAHEIHNLKSDLLTVDPEVVESNMLLLNFPSPRLTSAQFVEKMAQINPGDKEKVIVRCGTWFRNRVRWVLHSDLTQEDLDLALQKIRSILV
ncbi:uncharacterized protein [Parasteatoda tepidariorum]|nr:probable low-specificity L-threonine aldolase 2 isoform X2 [Parasteatoda tepidariorum]